MKKTLKILIPHIFSLASKEKIEMLISGKRDEQGKNSMNLQRWLCKDTEKLIIRMSVIRHYHSCHLALQEMLCGDLLVYARNCSLASTGTHRNFMKMSKW